MYLNLDKDKHEEIMKQIHVYKWTRPKIISNIEDEISQLRMRENLSLPQICIVLREELDLEISSGNLSTILRRLKSMEIWEKNYLLRQVHKNLPTIPNRRKNETKMNDVKPNEEPKPIEETSLPWELNEKRQNDTKPDDELEQKNLTENFDNFSLEELPI